MGGGGEVQRFKICTYKSAKWPTLYFPFIFCSSRTFCSLSKILEQIPVSVVILHYGSVLELGRLFYFMGLRFLMART